jgi:cobalt-zinc-cadmium efflux system membrane fusion protein
VNRSGNGSLRLARAALASALALLATSACGRDARDGRGDARVAAAAAEFAKGPHGGRWLEDDSFALELAIHERGVPPEYRAWIYENGELRDPAGVALVVTLRRLAGRVDRIGFAARGDHLVGDREVREPHSFDVEVVARSDGRDHRFAFASYEGRVELSAEQVAAAGIEIAEVAPAIVREHVMLSGRIAANEDALAHLMPRFPGVVRSVHKRLGDPVAAGDLLAVIESNESLHPYELRARLAGSVIAKEISPGEFVSSDRQVFAIADLSTVWADLDVYRPDFGRLRVGQPVRIDAGDGTPPVQSEIAYLSPIGSPSTQTLLARAVLPNPDRTWRPGLFVTAEVETAGEEAATTVAASAIQRLRDWDVVFLAEEPWFEAQPVTLGRRDAERVEVLAGLAPGQRYVAAGSFVVKAEVGKSGASHDH